MNYSDSFYFTTLADCADYNYFADYVKANIRLGGSLSENIACEPETSL